MTTSPSPVVPARRFAPRVEELRQRALSYLARHHTMSLATQGAEGPWASTVFYVNVGFDLYFRSKPSTRHVRDVLACPRVAATIHRDAEDWVAVEGVQLEGIGGRVEDQGECLEVMRRFVDRYPLVDTLWGPEEDSAEIWTSPRATRSLFRLRPTRLRFHDHDYADVPGELSGPELTVAQVG
jgi:uncharacterized protein YhbP (UPF0306 family)